MPELLPVPVTARHTPSVGPGDAAIAPPTIDIASHLDLREACAILRRRAWLVLLVLSLAVGYAVYAIQTRPVSYRAKATIRLLNTRGAMTSGLVERSAEQVAVYAYPIKSQLEVIASRSVVGEAVDSGAPLGIRVRTSGFPIANVSDLTLHGDASGRRMALVFGSDGLVATSGATERRAAYGERFRLGDIELRITRPPRKVGQGALYVLPREQAVDLMVGGLLASEREMTDVIDVTYTADDPTAAVATVNAVVRAFQSTDVRAAQEQSRRRRIFIDQQLRESDALLTAAEERLGDFRRREQAFSSREKFAAHREQLLSLDTQRQTADADRRVYLILLDRLSQPATAADPAPARSLASLVNVSSNPVIAQLQSQLSEYERSRTEMTSGTWGSAATHPDVQRLDTLYRVTAEKLRAAVRDQVMLLEARIRLIDESRERAITTLGRLPSAETEETQLVQQASAYRTQTEHLELERQQARIAEAAQVGQVAILDTATRAQPLRASVQRVVLFAIGLGLLFGVGGAFLLDSTDGTIRRRPDAERAVGLPTLAIIPQISEKRGILQRLGGMLRPGNVTLEMTRKTPSPAVALEARSPGAEAFRRLRTAISYSQSGGSARQIVVTSAVAEEGKTSVASHLAMTYATQGRRVLLIDADLRRARIHEVFHMAASPGISDLMLGQRPLDETVRRTCIPGLWVLTSGSATVEPTEMLSTTKWRAVLAQLKASFDLVVMDSPPVLATADAAVLGADADGVLLVLRAGRSQRAEGHEAQRILSSVGARVFGSVLNDPDAVTPRYGEGHYYQTYLAHGVS